MGRGELAVVSPLLQQLIGKEPKTIDETLAEVLGHGGTGGVNETSHYSRTTA